MLRTEETGHRELYAVQRIFSQPSEADPTVSETEITTAPPPPMLGSFHARESIGASVLGYSAR